MVDKSAIRILVLDDEPFMLKLISHELTNQGFSQVTTCDNGRAALELYDSTNNLPNLILLDLNMPVMDGLEFVRHLVERRYTGSLILISGENVRIRQSAGKLAQTNNIPVLGHLHKPVNPEDLSTLLEQWMPPCLSRSLLAAKTYSADEVRVAIENDELVNYYQPKVEMVSGKVVGVESLVRWHHPQDGLVFPDQFISVAEEHGLIDNLTWAVIGEAFSQVKTWQNAGLHLRVAINISMGNLASRKFADSVAAAADAAGILPDDIVLEVTESQLMKEFSVALEVLTRLRLKRFGLSIDDFGTGHSSLIQLSDIPFNELKIDQRFVHGAGSNDTLRVIFYSCLHLARQLGMRTVAEGVEERADWDFLRSAECEVAQGYFIARPMPADKIPDWIVLWEANIGHLIESSGVH